MYLPAERIETDTGKEIVSNNTPQNVLDLITGSFGEENVNADTGIWLPAPEIGDGVEVLIARLGNPEFERMMDALSAPYDRKRKPVPRKVIREATPRVYAATIWRDIRGLSEGVPVPNRNEREAALRKSPKFFDRIHDLADELNDNAEEERETALGNSSTSSAGA